MSIDLLTHDDLQGGRGSVWNYVLRNSSLSGLLHPAVHRTARRASNIDRNVRCDTGITSSWRQRFRKKNGNRALQEN